MSDALAAESATLLTDEAVVTTDPVDLSRYYVPEAEE
jgi:hypothetical protein